MKSVSGGMTVVSMAASAITVNPNAGEGGWVCLLRQYGWELIRGGARMGSASWIWLVIIGACIGAYYLYRQEKLPWLKGLRMPKLFEPKPDDLTEKLKAQTEKEMAKAVELRKLLEVKTELAKAKAENIRLRRKIDRVSETSVEKEEQVAEQDKQDAEKVKPRRL